MQNIRKNKPEGATHYHPSEPIYIKFGKKYDVYAWHNGRWLRLTSALKNGMMPEIKPLF